MKRSSSWQGAHQLAVKSSITGCPASSAAAKAASSSGGKVMLWVGVVAMMAIPPATAATPTPRFIQRKPARVAALRSRKPR